MEKQYIGCKGLTWVPTNLRGHHGDVVPGRVLSVQRLRRPDHAAVLVDSEVADSLLFAVQEIPAREGNAHSYVGTLKNAQKYRVKSLSE